MRTEQTPLISVLMLTYNHAPYIEQAIQSVLAQQTEYPFELIICDDASTDGAQDIAARYAEEDARVKLSFQPVNTRFGKNFVDGCEKIRGKYVAFCEGDDYWTDTGKLQKQVAFLEAHPDFSVCAHRVQMLHGDTQPRPSGFIYKDCSADELRIKNGEFYADEAIANYYFQTGSLVLRWRFSSGLPHWFRQRMMFDHFMLMLHAVEGKIKYFDEVMSVWRRHGSGFTWLQTQDKGLFFQKEGTDWIEMYTYMDNFFSNRFTYQIRERINLALRSMAQNCIETGNIDTLRWLVKVYSGAFRIALKDRVLLDAYRLANPDDPEFAPPWSSPPVDPAAPRPPEQAEARHALPHAGEEDKALCLVSPSLAIEDIPKCGGNVWEKWVGERPHAAFSNLRSALCQWMWDNGMTQIWLPVYAPPCLTDVMQKAQLRHLYYDVSPELEPSTDFLAKLQPGDCVLAIEYLGRPLPDTFLAAVRAHPGVRLIIDRAQSLSHDEPDCAEGVLYSPRKLFGVPDGGLLVGPAARRTSPGVEAAACDALRERETLLLERLEQGGQPNPALETLLRKQESERLLSRRKMSRLTRLVLERIPWEAAAEKRVRNWEYLYQRLGPCCLWQTASPDFAPYAFPLLSPEGVPCEVIHTLLTRQGINCQRMWYRLSVPKLVYPLAEALSKRLLLLPLDPRLGRRELEKIVRGVESIMKDGNYLNTAALHY